MSDASDQAAPRKRPRKPKPIRAFGRNLSDFGHLMDAEKRLIAACNKGEMLNLADTRPENASSENEIRAGLVRFLCLGGDETTPVHESGVRLSGAFIRDLLDFDSATVATPLFLRYCSFNRGIYLRDANTKGIYLEGSYARRVDADRAHITGSLFMDGGFSADTIQLGGSFITGDLALGESVLGADQNNVSIAADGARVLGDVFLREGFRAEGSVRFIGAKVDGDFTCEGARLEGNPTALLADRMVVGGSFFFHEASVAVGEVHIMGAEIGGAFDCGSSTFEGANGNALLAERLFVKGSVLLWQGFEARGFVSFRTANVIGDFLCLDASFTSTDEFAFVGQGMTVGRLFAWKKINRVVGSISLESMKVSTLDDDLRSYAGATTVKLDGFHYEKISGGPTDAGSRLIWLKRSSENAKEQGFWPQPWEQLIHVLRQMGHPEDAKVIAIEKQRELARRRLIGARLSGGKPPGPQRALEYIWVPLSNGLARFLHRIYGSLAGYGYRPMQTVGWMMVSWILGALVYWAAAEDGMMGPTNVRVYMDEKLAVCGSGGDPGHEPWPTCDAMPAEYMTFNPVIYSLDLSLPVVDLHQESEWAPLSQNRRGQSLHGASLLRGLVWLQIVFGWLTSLLLVSALGRLIQGDK